MKTQKSPCLENRFFLQDHLANQDTFFFKQRYKLYLWFGAEKFNFELILIAINYLLWNFLGAQIFFHPTSKIKISLLVSYLLCFCAIWKLEHLAFEAWSGFFLYLLSFRHNEPKPNLFLILKNSNLGQVFRPAF